MFSNAFLLVCLLLVVDVFRRHHHYYANGQGCSVNQTEHEYSAHLIDPENENEFHELLSANIEGNISLEIMGTNTYIFADHGGFGPSSYPSTFKTTRIAWTVHPTTTSNVTRVQCRPPFLVQANPTWDNGIPTLKFWPGMGMINANRGGVVVEIPSHQLQKMTIFADVIPKDVQVHHGFTNLDYLSINPDTPPGYCPSEGEALRFKGSFSSVQEHVVGLNLDGAGATAEMDFRRYSILGEITSVNSYFRIKGTRDGSHDTFDIRTHTAANNCDATSENLTTLVLDGPHSRAMKLYGSYNSSVPPGDPVVYPDSDPGQYLEVQYNDPSGNFDCYSSPSSCILDSSKGCLQCREIEETESVETIYPCTNSRDEASWNEIYCDYDNHHYCWTEPIYEDFKSDSTVRSAMAAIFFLVFVTALTT